MQYYLSVAFKMKCTCAITAVAVLLGTASAQTFRRLGACPTLGVFTNMFEIHDIS